MSQKNQNEHKFHIELTGLEMSEEALNNICSGIQQVVMKEIASIDYKGEYVVKQLPQELEARLGGRLGGKAIRFQ
jgi:hypothetical protein